MRTHNNVARLHINANRRLFVAAVAAAVAAHPGITESDLMATLRGSGNAFYPPSFIHWSFGPYDFRSAVGAMVREGLLVEHSTPRKTTYAVDEARREAVLAAWHELKEKWS